VHEYSEQIGTVQGDVWVWQPPGQFDAAVGVEGPPHRFWAMHDEVERRTPVHVLGGCVGDGVGGTVLHDGSMYLQLLPGTSTKAGVASKLISKVVRVVKTVGFVASAWPRVLSTMPRNARSWFSSLCFAAAPPSPQPPTASRKQSAKCRLSGLVKVRSSKVSPQQSQIARQSSWSIEWLFEFSLFQRSGQF